MRPINPMVLSGGAGVVSNLTTRRTVRARCSGRNVRGVIQVSTIQYDATTFSTVWVLMSGRRAPNARTPRHDSVRLSKIFSI
jgi:hypothetical protein